MNELFEVECSLCKKFITSESQEAEGASGIISTATMIDSHQFWYGLSGVMKFNIDLGLVAGDHLCYTCMTKHKDVIDESKTVACANCKELYSAVNEGSNTAWDCSGEVYKKHDKLWISCGWGSKHDMCLFYVCVPVVKDGDVVCDKCINTFEEEGTITLEKTTLYD